MSPLPQRLSVRNFAEEKYDFKNNNYTKYICNLLIYNNFEILKSWNLKY